MWLLRSVQLPQLVSITNYSGGGSNPHIQKTGFSGVCTAVTFTPMTLTLTCRVARNVAE
jgi:hypothetical protein